MKPSHTAFALLTAPVALGQCQADSDCDAGVGAMLNGGLFLANYASDLCSSAVATTTTVGVSFPYNQRIQLRKIQERHLLAGPHNEREVPLWAYGCASDEDFVKACSCYGEFPPWTATYTDPWYNEEPTPMSTKVKPTKAHPTTSPAKTSSSAEVPYHHTSSAKKTSSKKPEEPSSTAPYSFESVATPSFLPGTSVSAFPSSIVYIPASAVTAGPSTANYSAPTFSSGVSVAALPSSALFEPEPEIVAAPTDPAAAPATPVFSSAGTSVTALPSSIQFMQPSEILAGPTAPGAAAAESPVFSSPGTSVKTLPSSILFLAPSEIAAGPTTVPSLAAGKPAENTSAFVAPLAAMATPESR